MIGVALVAQDLIEARRERDTLLARGRMPAPQKIGAQIAATESTILDLVATIVAERSRADEDDGPVSAALATRCTPKPKASNGALTEARRRVALTALRELIAQGVRGYPDMAAALNARAIAAPRGGAWTSTQVAAFMQRHRLLPIDRQAVRTCRTRTRPTTSPNSAVSLAS